MRLKTVCRSPHCLMDQSLAWTADECTSAFDQYPVCGNTTLSHASSLAITSAADVQDKDTVEAIERIIHEPSGLDSALWDDLRRRLYEDAKPTRRALRRS